MSQGNYRESYEQPGQAVDTRVSEHHVTISPARIVGFIVGVILLIVSIMVIADAGIDSTLNKPVVEVMGLEMSAIVGIVLLVVGLILVLAAATYGGGSVVGVMGILLLLGGVFAVAASDELRADVGVGRDTGWFMIVLGAVCMAGLFFNSRTIGRRRVHQDVDSNRPAGTYPSGQAPPPRAY